MNRNLIRRYHYIEKARDAEIVGIVVATLGVGTLFSLFSHSFSLFSFLFLSPPFLQKNKTKQNKKKKDMKRNLIYYIEKGRGVEIVEIVVATLCVVHFSPPFSSLLLSPFSPLILLFKKRDTWR
jgi:uncharacterized membrane protein YkgB